jgi:hypothetical protein
MGGNAEPLGAEPVVFLMNRAAPEESSDPINYLTVEERSRLGHDTVGNKIPLLLSSGAARDNATENS